MTYRSKQCTSIILFEYRIRTSNNLSTIISLLNDWSLPNLKCFCLQGRSQRGKLTYDSSIIQNNSKSRPLLEIGKLVHLVQIGTFMPHWWVVKILIWFFGFVIIGYMTSFYRTATSLISSFPWVTDTFYLLVINRIAIYNCLSKI